MAQELTLTPPSMPMPPDVATEYGVSVSQWRVLVDQLFPTAKSTGAIELALAYCKSRNLDIYKRPVHIVPMYSSVLKREVETVWPGISEIRTTATRTGQYAGIDEVVWGPDKTEKFTITRWEKPDDGGRSKQVTVEEEVTYPAWASVVVYRLVGGHRQAFHTKVFWKEACATIGKSKTPNEMWRKRPYGQLDKCVEAAGLRKAFPEEIGGQLVAEEVEGKVYDHATATQRQATAATAHAPNPDDDGVVEGDVVDAEVEELADRIASDDDEVERKPAEKKVEPTKAGPATREAPNPDDDQDQVGEEEVGETADQVLDRLDAAMIAAKDAASVEEVWTEFDLEAKWTHDADAIGNLRVAKGLRNSHTRRVEKAAADAKAKKDAKAAKKAGDGTETA